MMTYSDERIKRLEDLEGILRAVARPVLLLEGTRALPEADLVMVTAVGRILAERLPGVTFRSGNADGTDTAFSIGVTSVAPDRMEYVVPHPGMGWKRRHPGGRVVALDQVPASQEPELDLYTAQASPKTLRVLQAIRERNVSGPIAAKAKYLLRDTLKVTGAPELDLAPATAALFYVNREDPLSGGTGHTIRVCLHRQVPVVFQHVWRNWLGS